jgi:hypothetical protein
VSLKAVRSRVCRETANIDLVFGIMAFTAHLWLATCTTPSVVSVAAARATQVTTVLNADRPQG